MKEHDLQKAIVDAIRLCGLTVYETTAFRQKGPSGVDKGIPDLLVSDPRGNGQYFGIEVKRPGHVRWSSPEQKEAFESGHFVVAQKVEEALGSIIVWLEKYPTSLSCSKSSLKAKAALEGLQPVRSR